MGKGLLRLFLALWLVWIVIGVADAYKEIATYMGSEQWSVEKATEKNIKRHEAECNVNPSSLICKISGSSYSPNDVVNEADAKRKVRAFIDVVTIAPLILLLSLFFIYMLGKWVVRGFKK
jgi:hypothetical protein